jgi:hypothetical protein
MYERFPSRNVEAGRVQVSPKDVRNYHQDGMFVMRSSLEGSEHYSIQLTVPVLYVFVPKPAIDD